ncbi:hypothetical protein HDV04_003172 [Boothiomyces sp. JEL0838]|nr:hypothetical protein HDV04_003163 [Boothiomyces sp. JEL0838]KAJ3312422.1 hypothetical protein HDV04_003172 [Boothiomyces sp. JEL0838]
MSQIDPDGPSIRRAGARGTDKEQSLRRGPPGKEKPRSELPVIDNATTSLELDSKSRNKEGNDSLSCNQTLILAQKQKMRAQKITDMIENDDFQADPLPQISRRAADSESVISKRDKPRIVNPNKEGESILRKGPEMSFRTKIPARIVFNEEDEDEDVSKKKRGLVDIIPKPGTADGTSFRTRRNEKLAEPLLDTPRRFSAIPPKKDEEVISEEPINLGGTRKTGVTGIGRMTAKTLKVLENFDENSTSLEGGLLSRKTVRATPVKPQVTENPMGAVVKNKNKSKQSGRTWEGKMYPNWRIMLCYAKLGVSLIKSYSAHYKAMQKVLDLPLSAGGQMAFIMQMFKTTADPLTQLLDPNVNRTRETINSIDQLLKFRTKAKYESFPEGRLICKEGQRAQNYYFILSGKIEIFTLKHGERDRMNVLNAGESFGRIQLINDIRMASKATLAPTELLVIDKREFANMTQLLTKEELQDQMDSLSRLPHFTKYKDFLAKTNSLFEILVYSTGDNILTEGQAETKIYFILEGHCKCTKKVPFIQKKGSGGKDIAIYEPSVPMGPNDEIIEHTFTIQELETSDHFPGINPETKKLNQIDLERAALTSETDFDATILEFSVTATSRIEVASIARSDYIKYATPDMLVETVQQKNLYEISVRQVQEGFLEKLKWDSYKRNTVDHMKKK